MIQFELVGDKCGLPYFALVALAVAEDAVHAVLFPVHFCGQRHAGGDGKAMAEAAGGELHAGDALMADVARQP